MALLLGCAALGVWFLQTERFQQIAREMLISRIEAATGLECRIERVQCRILRGRLFLSGISLSPRAAAPGLVSLRVDAVHAAISISSIWHFRIRLAELLIDRPQVELISGGEGAKWNPEAMLQSLKMSLRLEAAKAEVRDGAIKINKRIAPFNLSLKNLDCAVRYSKEQPSYKIHLGYESGRIFWEQRNIVHDLAVSADLSLQGVEIEFFKFRYRASLLTGSGSFRNWDAPQLRIHAAGVYDAKDLTLAHASIKEGHGAIGVTADLRYDPHGVEVKGDFTVRSGGYRRMNFHDLAGRFEIRQDVLYLRNVSGKIAQGSLKVHSDIQLREANRDLNRVAVTSKSVPIVEVGRLLDLPLLRFSNAADATAAITWKKGDEDLRVECDAQVHGMAQSSAQPGSGLPLDGSIQFTYLGTGDVFITSANLRSPDSSIQASGQPGESFQVDISTNRIAEPFKLIAGFSAPIADLISRRPDVLNIAGRYQFSGDVRIKSALDITYRGNIAVKNGAWRSFKIDALAAQADFRPPYLQLRGASIRRGIQAVEGDIDLELADPEQVSSFGFRGAVRQVSMESLRDFGADTANLGGEFSGSGSVRYAKGAWEGEGDIRIDEGLYKGESFDLLRAKVQFRDQRLRLQGVEGQRGTAHATADGSIDIQRRFLDLNIRLKNLSLADVPLVRKRNLPVHGLASAAGSFKGSFDDPSFDGTVELNSLQYNSYNLGNGKGSIRFESKTVQSLIQIRSEYGSLAIQARVSTEPDYAGAVNLEFDNLEIRKILAEKIPSYLKDVSTALKGTVGIEGRFSDPSTIRIRGEVDGAHFKVQDYELRNAGRIRFAATHRNLRIESVQFVGAGTSLVLSGDIPFGDAPHPFADAPQLDLNLNGRLNLRLLNGFDKKFQMGGAATLNIRASGAKQNPQIIGRASFLDARLDHVDLPFQFTGLQGDMVFSRNLVRFENVRGASASGTMQVSGILEHRNAVIQSINMSISLRNARLPYPKDFRSIAHADLVLNGTGDVQILSGDINVIRAEYVRSFNLLEQLAGGSTIQSGPLTTEPLLRGLRLNVEIHSENGLLIDNELTRLQGSLRLTLRGTPAYPSLTGRVEANEGTIYFRGSRFEISHAYADFIDRNRINPILEIRAEADVKTYRLILDAIGDLEHLNLNITSDPQMSTVEILALLTTGKTDTDTANTQRRSEMVGVSAVSVLSENLTGVIGKRVQRIFGLESFRVDPFLAGAENDPTARITISERISKDLVVTFSRNLTTNQDQIVVIEYDVTKNLSLVATRDEDGKYGLDFRFRKRFR